MGSLTAFFAASVGLVQNDLKKVDTLLKISDEEIIREIGMIYLNRHPNENSIDKLEKLLLGNYDLNKITDILIYNLMKEKIHFDFEQKNIVIIKGWILSVTETRQCALYALK